MHVIFAVLHVTSNSIKIEYASIAFYIKILKMKSGTWYKYTNYLQKYKNELARIKNIDKPSKKYT